MIEVVRLSTVHPALVHFTIGALPLIVFAYAIAARRRSERWTFAADAALVVTAALTIATAAFGLVSNAVVPWPGGLELWRWLHLGFGAASAAALLALAAVRLSQRRTGSTSGGGTFIAALVIALAIGFTGWVGGEVLVFRSGVAVRAAGDGALAPPAVRARSPKHLLDAMDRLRAAWAAAESTTSAMIVQQPSDRDFRAIEDDARGMSQLSAWIATEGPRSLPNASQLIAHHHEADAHEHAPMTAGEHLSVMARELGEKTASLEKAARARDVVGTARLLGAIQADCAECHAELRWQAPAARQAQR